MLWSYCGLIRRWLQKISPRSSKNILGEKNTTYTVIKRLIEKGAITREDPGFICRANVSKKKVQEIETKALLNKLYNGSVSQFITEYLVNQKLSSDDLAALEFAISRRMTK